uniref:Uncharacterized protein n=1 Tax=Lygus hesperus TaxID=30085 RepID=A0A146M943_LYGHE
MASPRVYRMAISIFENLINLDVGADLIDGNAAHAAEPQVSSAGVRRVVVSTRTSVAVAIRYVTHEGTAFLHFLYTIVWASRVVQGSFVMHCSPPVFNPLPDVSRHFVKAEIVGWERPGGSCPLETVFFIVVFREHARPGVSPVFVEGFHIVAPWKIFFIFSTSTSVFPLCFSWQSLSSPFAVSHGIIPRNSNNWMVLKVCPRRSYTKWLLPIGSLDIIPPGCHRHAGNEILFPRYFSNLLIKDDRIVEFFRIRHVIGLFHEDGELFVGNFGFIHVECIDINLAFRVFSIIPEQILVVVSHDEFSFGYENHFPPFGIAGSILHDIFVGQKVAHTFLGPVVDKKGGGRTFIQDVLFGFPADFAATAVTSR